MRSTKEPDVRCHLRSLRSSVLDLIAFLYEKLTSTNIDNTVNTRRTSILRSKVCFFIRRGSLNRADDAVHAAAPPRHSQTDVSSRDEDHRRAYEPHARSSLPDPSQHPDRRRARVVHRSHDEDHHDVHSSPAAHPSPAASTSGETCQRGELTRDPAAQQEPEVPEGARHHRSPSRDLRGDPEPGRAPSAASGSLGSHHRGDHPHHAHRARRKGLRVRARSHGARHSLRRATFPRARRGHPPPVVFARSPPSHAAHEAGGLEETASVHSPTPTEAASRSSHPSEHEDRRATEPEWEDEDPPSPHHLEEHSAHTRAASSEEVERHPPKGSHRHPHQHDEAQPLPPSDKHARSHARRHSSSSRRRARGRVSHRHHHPSARDARRSPGRHHHSRSPPPLRTNHSRSPERRHSPPPLHRSHSHSPRHH